MEICVIEPGGTVAPFLQLTGEAAVGLPGRGNELAGVIFDPSGRRLYFAAQRAFGLGAVYEVTGPFPAAGRRAGSAPRREGRRARPGRGARPAARLAPGAAARDRGRGPARRARRSCASRCAPTR